MSTEGVLLGWSSGNIRAYQESREDPKSDMLPPGLAVSVRPDPSSHVLLMYAQVTMEGKGMLMIDQDNAQPLHTVWVIKPPPLLALTQRSTCLVENLQGWW